MHIVLKKVQTAVALLLLAVGARSVEAAGSGALFYDEQTVTNPTDSRVRVEGMAWGYFHTGPLAAPLTLTSANPVEIQLFDRDLGERYVGGLDDELQLWRSDASLTAAAGESVRFEFFSVVPSDRLRAAGLEYKEMELEIEARFQMAPDGLASEWNTSSWPSSARNFSNRASSFEGYPTADHVVRLYYVHPGRGFRGVTPGGRRIEAFINDENKELWAIAAVGELLVDSKTDEEDWQTGLGVTGAGRSMRGFVLVRNPSDRHGLTVNLDFLELWENDFDAIGNDNDLLGEASSSAPANFNLGPGGTLTWTIDIQPKWEDIVSARDLGGLDGDLEPFSVFSVNGDPLLPVEILPNDEMDAFGDDLPLSTFTFAAANVPSQLPPPPLVTYQGNTGTYTIDQDVNITCTVVERGGGVVSHSCVDIVGPAWSFPAGSNVFSASAYDFYGQKGTGNVIFDVVVTPESLIAITKRFVDHHGIENSLIKKIEVVARTRSDKAQDGACQAYINEVVAQTDKFITEEVAEILIYWGKQLKLQ